MDMGEAGLHVFLRDSVGQNETVKPVVQDEEEKKIGTDEALFCKSCLNQITRKDQAIRINGSHSHTFFNPNGIVFELGCFGDAPGCLVMGEPTSEFTWFSGSVWQFALCRTCGAHLGWYYETGESGFYGLLPARLQE